LAIALKENSDKQNPVQIGYAAEPPSLWWPRGVLASAHINKLMIIAKRETHTHNKQNKQKG